MNLKGKRLNIYWRRSIFIMISVFQRILTKFKEKSNFLQYHGLLSAISCQWKKLLKQEQQAATVNLPEIDMLTCKTIYKSLIDCQNFSSPTVEKRLIECGFGIHERQKIYSLPFLVTKDFFFRFSDFYYYALFTKYNKINTHRNYMKYKKKEIKQCITREIVLSDQSSISFSVGQ